MYMALSKYLSDKYICTKIKFAAIQSNYHKRKINLFSFFLHHHILFYTYLIHFAPSTS